MKKFILSILLICSITILSCSDKPSEEIIKEKVNEYVDSHGHSDGDFIWRNRSVTNVKIIEWGENGYVKLKITVEADKFEYTGVEASNSSGYYIPLGRSHYTIFKSFQFYKNNFDEWEMKYLLNEIQF